MKNYQGIVDYDVWIHVGNNVKNHVWFMVERTIWNTVYDSIWDNVRNNVWFMVERTIWNTVYDSIWDNVRNNVWNNIGHHISNVVLVNVKTVFHYNSIQQYKDNL
jgi:hypothetical protein